METSENVVPVRIHCWDKDYVYKGQVSAPLSVGSLVRNNNAGFLTFVLPIGHPRIGDLSSPGARASVQLLRKRPDGAVVWKTLISGPVEEVRGEGTVPEDVRVYTVDDDFLVMDQIIVQPDPNNKFNPSTEFWVLEDVAEDVLLDVLQVADDDTELSYETSQSRGSTITARFRWQPVSDILFPLVTQAGLRVQVTQEPGETTRTVRISEPTVHTRVLTEESGIILPGGEFTIKPPTVTRVVMGDNQEGLNRIFRQRINNSAETKWGMVKMAFLDLSDINGTNWAVDPTYIEPADTFLEENDEKTSLKVELIETPTFQAFETFDVGDTLPIELTGAGVLSATVSEVELVWDASEGLVVTPRVGEWTESTNDDLYKLVAKLAKRVRNREVY